MAPEIWSTTDRIFCPFGLFFVPFSPYGSRKSKFWKNEKNAWRYYHFGHVHHTWNPIIYGFWDMECDGQNFLSFQTLFLPSYPPKNLKNQTFEKMKKHVELSYFTHLYHKWQPYNVWLLRYGHNCLLFWTIYCPFTTLRTQKNKNFEKREKTLEILWFYTCVW